MFQGGHGSHPLVKAQWPLGVFYESNCHGGAGQWNPRGLGKSCDSFVWKAESTVEGNFLAGPRQRQMTGKSKVRVN